METKQCKQCNKPFTPTKSNHIFCSPKCKRLYHHRLQHPLTPIMCERCGRVFPPKSNKEKYCSDYCAEETNRYKAKLLIFKNRRLFPELYYNELGSKNTSTSYHLIRDKEGKPDFKKERKQILKEKRRLGL